MAAGDVSTMVLRFRDLVTSPGGTIQEHADVIGSEGYVWWGWWSKAGERIPDDVFRHLQSKANNATRATKGALLFLAFHRVASKERWPNAIPRFQAAAAVGKAFNRLRMALHCANDAD